MRRSTLYTGRERSFARTLGEKVCQVGVFSKFCRRDGIFMGIVPWWKQSGGNGINTKRIPYLLIVRLFRCDPNKPCIRTMGGPLIVLDSGGSCLWNARSMTSRRVVELEKYRRAGCPHAEMRCLRIASHSPETCLVVPGILLGCMVFCRDCVETCWGPGVSPKNGRFIGETSADPWFRKISYRESRTSTPSCR